MSWSLTIDDLPNYGGPYPEELERIARDNISCVDDMYQALAICKARRFSSCVLSGGRTSVPEIADEICDISIRGMVVAKGVQEAIKDTLRFGPDETTSLWAIQVAEGIRCGACGRVVGMPTAQCEYCPDE